MSFLSFLSEANVIKFGIIAIIAAIILVLVVIFSIRMPNVTELING